MKALGECEPESPATVAIPSNCANCFTFRFPSCFKTHRQESVILIHSLRSGKSSRPNQYALTRPRKSSRPNQYALTRPRRSSQLSKSPGT
uniref:Uncharacterized protein n=1 Tax=Picea sitchensis TaxID=3332 RepID=A0A6B9XRV5_PICSI|nr:hypothetical protein Q903MT_gene6726 [Picea sitchensis]